jgi:lipoprotein-anchoring transpeptidase ErfK/SrfK
MKREWLVILMVFVGCACMAQEQRVRFEAYRSGFNQDVLALQILLDRLNFSCNCIDGSWGKRTQIALMAWQAVNGKEVTGIPTGEILDALGGDGDILTTYTVTDKDLNDLGPFPEDWLERSRLPGMKYVTLQEMLAERSHASEHLIQRLNPNATWPNPPAGTEITLPNVTQPKRRVKVDSIRISLGRMEVTLFDAAGKMIALFPCSIARDKARRPVGSLNVKDVAQNPTYTYDPQLFKPGGPEKAKLIIPPGPNNPVGVAWISLSVQGFGMHGTPFPERIGNAESKGCFRLANWNAEKLYRMIVIGIPVVVEED